MLEYQYVTSLPKPVYECSVDEIKAWAEAVYQQAADMIENPGLVEGYAQALEDGWLRAGKSPASAAQRAATARRETLKHCRGVLSAGRPWFVHAGQPTFAGRPQSVLVTVSMTPNNNTAEDQRYIMPMVNLN